MPAKIYVVGDPEPFRVMADPDAVVAALQAADTLTLAFVELETPFGQSVYFNPSHVAAVDHP